MILPNFCSQGGACSGMSMVFSAVPTSDLPGTPKCTRGKGTELAILVVEDDLVSALAVTKLLEKCGHKVRTAYNGQEGIDLARISEFDLILMDIEMPVMDGLEVTKIIRGATDWACPSNVPIVAMTGHTMNGDKERFLKAGMNAVLSKPFHVGRLQAVIASLLSSR